MLLIIFLGVACLIVMAVLFARIVVSLCIEHVPERSALSLVIYWMHPSMLRGVIDVRRKALELWLLRRFRIWPAPWSKKTSDSIEPHMPPPPSSSHSSSTIFEQDSFQGDAGSPKGKPHDGGGSRRRDDEQDDSSEEPLKERAIGALEKMKRSTIMRTFSFILNASWRSKMLRWLKRCVCLLPKLGTYRSTDMQVRAGLGDPALTGRLFGCVTGAYNAGFPGINNLCIVTFEPVFNEECFFIKGSISLQSSLMRIMKLIACAAMTFPYFSTIKTWRASKR
jgi:hypothetical protein